MELSANSSVQITYYNNKIILSKDSLFKKSGKVDRKELMLMNRSTVYNGFMSDSTKRKITKILTSWSKAIEKENEQRKIALMKIERRLTFITLTLSEAQKHDDLFIKRKMLNRFIIYLQSKQGVKYYLWKAEKMMNGRLHIHLIVDCFIDMKIVQTEWNKIQDDYGYLNEYREKFRKDNPPSTHIEKVEDLEGAIEYCLKYMSKKESDKINNGLKVKGRIWGCSDELRTLKIYNTGENDKVVTELYRLVNESRIKKISDEFFELYITNTESFLRTRCRVEYVRYCDYYMSLYKELYDKQMICQSSEMPMKQGLRDIINKQSKSYQLSIPGFERDENYYH